MDVGDFFFFYAKENVIFFLTNAKENVLNKKKVQ
jgi:hypothetical protein